MEGQVQAAEVKGERREVRRKRGRGGGRGGMVEVGGNVWVWGLLIGYCFAAIIDVKRRKRIER